MFQPVKFGFGKPNAKTAGAPTPLSTQAMHRRAAMLKEAQDVLDHLPAPGESLHALMTGYYDLTMLLACIIEQHSEPCEHLRIATLSMSQRNVFELLRLIDSGKVGRLSIVISRFFRGQKTSLFESTQKELRERLGRHCLIADRCHAKVITMNMGTDRLSMEGSANLSTNDNIEQFCLLNHPQVHDWHAAWIDDMVSNANL